MDFGDHKSWQAYEESLSEPLRFDAEANEDERNHAFEVLGKANAHFYQQHISTLSPEVQAELKNGTHPSQSHELDEQALPIFEQFWSSLEENCTIPIYDAALGHYHGDQIIFSVRFDSEKPWSEIDEEIPSFFAGFRVKRNRQSTYDALSEPELKQGIPKLSKSKKTFQWMLIGILCLFMGWLIYDNRYHSVRGEIPLSISMEKLRKLRVMVGDSERARVLYNHYIARSGSIYDYRQAKKWNDYGLENDAAWSDKKTSKLLE